jgi:small subunit ribosomal protein S16
MVKVRLSRHGAKKRPYYHIVVTDSENRRDGRYIEQIGTYDPSKPPDEARVAEERLAYWLGVGAQVSDAVAALLRRKRAAASPN